MNTFQNRRLHFSSSQTTGVKGLRLDNAAFGLMVISLISFATIQVAGAQSAGDRLPTQAGDLVIYPVNHATLVLSWSEKTIYVDSVGGAKRFDGFPKPDLVLLTDIHGDHLSAETLSAVVGSQTEVIAPPAVHKLLSPELQQRAIIMTNGQTKSLLGLKIEAVPMYNLAPDRSKFHPKGRGNGYVLTLGGKRIYLSGDTEDIPEMLALKDIDVAFVCMNLPYTMEVSQAARAARQFRPRIVYPYHCRGSDLEKFKELVGNDLDIEVRLRKWY
jgi:L-ascorbate metabolism protein UlaG (beta-lactamase superfamily)